MRNHRTQHRSTSSPAIHYELKTTCPECGADLDLRRRKADGHSFVGCSSYPRCRFTADAGDQDIRRDLFEAWRKIDDLERNVSPAAPSKIGKKIREVIAWAHPDRHPDGRLDATEITARLNALRSEVIA